MEKYLTIGVAGQLGSGKDVVSDYLCEKLNLNNDCGYWIRKRFAYAVKKVFMDTFNVDWDFIEKWKRISEPPPGFKKNVRESLIFIGDGFRSIVSDIWIEIVFRDMNSNQIVSDVRYLNEAEYIREQDGINILIWRPGHENNIQNGSEQSVVPYINELRNREENIDCVMLNEPDFPFDMFVINDGDLLSLYEKIDKLVLPQLLRRISQSRSLVKQ